MTQKEDRARRTQNIIFGSFSEHPRQSLSLPSNCERMTTPSSIVEHNLAAAALQDMSALFHCARSMLFGSLLLYILYANACLKCHCTVICEECCSQFSFCDLISTKSQLPFSNSSLSCLCCSTAEKHFPKMFLTYFYGSFLIL